MRVSKKFILKYPYTYLPFYLFMLKGYSMRISKKFIMRTFISFDSNMLDIELNKSEEMDAITSSSCSLVFLVCTSSKLLLISRSFQIGK